MKINIIVLAAAAALSSHAAFARYDGGDTWSEVESKSYVSTSGTVSDLGATPARYDGGDTWSELESKSYVSTSGIMSSNDPGATSARYDGGDTWSELESNSVAGLPQSLTSQR
jgi:hypothetical protein